MRGALEPIASVEILELEAGKKPFKIKFDPKKTEVAKILAALEEAGEPAKQLD